VRISARSTLLGAIVTNNSASTLEATNTLTEHKYVWVTVKLIAVQRHSAFPKHKMSVVKQRHPFYM